MSGHYKGTKALIQEMYPLAIYVHCKAHSLNLALVHSSSQPDVTNMFGIFQQAAMYLGASAKHLKIFRDINNASEVDDMPDRQGVDALTTLKAKIYSVVALDKLGNGTGSDVKAQTHFSLLSVISDSL